MSLLELLKSKKTELKSTETTVTRQDGQKYIETGSSTSCKLDARSFGYVVDTKPDDIPGKIIEHFFIGSQDCCDSEVLSKYAIKHVLSIGIEAPFKYQNVRYKFVKMLDLQETKLEKHLPECISFIENGLGQRENVLIHCNAGVSRSASIAMGYLILRKDLRFEEAFDLVKKARSCVRPNDGFLVQLRYLRK